MSVLHLSSLEAGYDTTPILFGIDLHIDQGEVVTLLGRNGMGKSTTIKTVCGVLQPTGGSVRFKDRDISGWPMERISQAGISVVPEGRRIFPNLTVYENLTAFSRAGRWSVQDVYDLFPVLKKRQHNMGGQLSGGEQQMLALSRALLTNAKLMLIDEATEGLAPLVRAEIWEFLSKLREEGQSMLIVDKYVKNLIDLADRHYFIQNGTIVWHGSSAALSEQPEVWETYLGL